MLPSGKLDFHILYRRDLMNRFFYYEYNKFAVQDPFRFRIIAASHDNLKIRDIMYKFSAILCKTETVFEKYL